MNNYFEKEIVTTKSAEDILKEFPIGSKVETCYNRGLGPLPYQYGVIESIDSENNGYLNIKFPNEHIHSIHWMNIKIIK